MELKDKVAVVTGASKGIGQAASVALAKTGVSVIINYNSDKAGAELTQKECDKYSKGNMIIKADISVEEEVKEMFNKIRSSYSHLDILINNAGIFDNNDSPTSIDSFENIFEHNFLSHVIVTKYALEIMKEGKIVNISSVHGRLGYGNPGAVAYSALKAALENYTKNLAKSLAPKILVNAVAPGRVATSLWDNLDEKREKELGRVHLTQRMIKPEEIADAIIFLCKNDSVCGEVLTVDGGMSIKTLIN